MIAPSGEQVELRAGPMSAVVVEVGGGIRALEMDGVPVLDGYSEEEMAEGGRGAPLLPWPNRIAGGSYRFEGRDHQLPITEVAAGNAIHGLTRWQPWVLDRASASSAAWRFRVHPQPGYPFTLDLEVEYEVWDRGLTVRTAARNSGPGPLPFAAGQHPYLSAGPGALVDGCRLELSAREVLQMGRGGIPTGRRLAAETVGAHLAGDGAIGTLRLDHCFTALARDAEGRARALLTRPDGMSVTLWAGASYRYLMLYSGDTLADPRRRREGLAVEPMSAPPNAFATGVDVVRIGAGGEWRGEWGIVVDLPAQRRM